MTNMDSGWRACIDHIIRPDSPCPVCENERLKAQIASLQAFIETIDHQYDAMQQIKSWCEAYPIDIFTPPDWVEARDKLGDKLLSRVSAANMRHVVDGIKEII